MNPNKKYAINNNTVENFKKLGFMNIGDGIYIHNFPCYKWNGFITITGRFTGCDDSKDIYVDVYQEDGRPYAPFYSTDWNKHGNEVLAIVISNVHKECKKCGIVEK